MDRGVVVGTPTDLRPLECSADPVSLTASLEGDGEKWRRCQHETRLELTSERLQTRDVPTENLPSPSETILEHLELTKAYRGAEFRKLTVQANVYRPSLVVKSEVLQPVNLPDDVVSRDATAPPSPIATVFVA